MTTTAAPRRHRHAAGDRRHRPAPTRRPATDAPATEAPTAPPADRDGRWNAPAPAGRPSARPPTPVKLQLQWFTQAQFAGYFAADRPGLLRRQCLDVEILEGGVDIVPQQQLADGDVDFAIAWVPKALASAGGRAPTSSNIAQIFQRSGTLQVSFADAGITDAGRLRRQEHRQLGLRQRVRDLRRAQPRPGSTRRPTSTSSPSSSTWSACSTGDIDAAEAMTYNEYAQVLEAENPDTGELYTPEDFNVISYEDVGVGMLQDAIWADGERLASDDRRTRDIAVALRRRLDPGLGVLPRQPRGVPRHRRRRRLAARRQPPAVADERDQQADLAGARTASASSTRRRGTARSRSPRTRPNLEGATVLTAPPTEGAFTNDIVEAACALLGDSVDTTGDGLRADRGHAGARRGLIPRSVLRNRPVRAGSEGQFATPRPARPARPCRRTSGLDRCRHSASTSAR